MSGPPYIKLVTEIDLKNGHKHTRYIRFPLDPLDAGKTFCYRSRMSINAFAFSGKERNYKPSKNKAKYLYHFQDWEDKVFMDNISKNFFGRDIHADVPIIDVDSIWEFYKLVGYNYKDKKWRK